MKHIRRTTVITEIYHDENWLARVIRTVWKKSICLNRKTKHQIHCTEIIILFLVEFNEYWNLSSIILSKLYVTPFTCECIFLTANTFLEPAFLPFSPPFLPPCLLSFLLFLFLLCVFIFICATYLICLIFRRAAIWTTISWLACTPALCI